MITITKSGMRILLLPLTWAVSSAATASGPGHALPKNDPGSWVEASDYPPQALREELEGVSRFRVELNSEGQIVSCEITSSSGSPILDEKTCELVKLRAQFDPAVDAEGKPIIGWWSSAVRWEIPDDPSDAPGDLIHSYVIEVDGTLSECKTYETAAGITTAHPSECPSEPPVLGPVLDEGKPVRALVTSYENNVYYIDTY